MSITIQSGSDIPPGVARALFVRNQWCDWLTEEDIQLYFDHSYHIASAWIGSSLVGLAVLVGDGSKCLELENLIVDKAHRRQGIGKALMENVMQAIESANPYFVKIEGFEEETQRFYGRFGFTRNEETWLLELNSASKALRTRIRTPLDT